MKSPNLIILICGKFVSNFDNAKIFCLNLQMNVKNNFSMYWMWAKDTFTHSLPFSFTGVILVKEILYFVISIFPVCFASLWISTVWLDGARPSKISLITNLTNSVPMHCSIGVCKETNHSLFSAQRWIHRRHLSCSVSSRYGQCYEPFLF